MTQMLGPSGGEFNVTVNNTLKALMDKVDNMQASLGNRSMEMERTRPHGRARSARQRRIDACGGHSMEKRSCKFEDRKIETTQTETQREIKIQTRAS